MAEQKELWEDEERGKKVKAVVCFTIKPAMRGKGIATQLLTRVCRDAAEEGYFYIEAYPIKGEPDVFENYHGPFRLYQKLGFTLYKELEQNCVVRKYL